MTAMKNDKNVNNKVDNKLETILRTKYGIQQKKIPRDPELWPVITRNEKELEADYEQFVKDEKENYRVEKIKKLLRSK
jgi:uncharacterized protein (DUF1697 family)